MFQAAQQRSQRHPDDGAVETASVNKSNDSSSCTRLGSLLYSVDTIIPMLFGRPCKATPFHRAEDQVVQIPYGLQSINNVCLKQFIKVSILSTLYFSSSFREPLKVSGPGLGHALVSHSIHLISSKLFKEMWLKYLGKNTRGDYFHWREKPGGPSKWQVERTGEHLLQSFSDLFV